MVESYAPPQGLPIEAILPGTAYVIASDAPLATRQMAQVLKPYYGDFIQICDGVADNVEIQAAINAVLAVGSGKVVLLEGTCNIVVNLDFAGIADIAGPFVFDSRAATLKAAANLTQLINLFPGAGKQILSKAQLLFGKIDLNSANYTVTRGIYIRHFNDNYVYILWLGNGTGDGVHIDQSDVPAAPGFGTFNNFFEFVFLGVMSGIGIRIDDNNTTLFFCGGNKFKVGQLAFCHDGVIVGQVINYRAYANFFLLGPVEHNTAFGIYDYCGGNTYIVHYTGVNGTAGFGCPSGITRKSTIIGHFTDGVQAAVKEHHLIDSFSGAALGQNTLVGTIPCLIYTPQSYTGTAHTPLRLIDNTTNLQFRIFNRPTPPPGRTLKGVLCWIERRTAGTTGEYCELWDVTASVQVVQLYETSALMRYFRSAPFNLPASTQDLQIRIWGAAADTAIATWGAWIELIAG